MRWRVRVDDGASAWWRAEVLVGVRVFRFAPRERRRWWWAYERAEREREREVKVREVRAGREE